MNVVAVAVLYSFVIILLLMNLGKDYEGMERKSRTSRRYSTEPPKWNPDLFDVDRSFRGRIPSCCGATTLLVAIVTSAPENHHKRQAIRESWGGFRDHTIGCEIWKYLFLVGKSRNRTVDDKVSRESKEYNDILIGTYHDTYRNLTKKVVHGLTWVAKYCRPTFLLKTDDDCYINRPLLVEFLQYHNEITENLYVGRVFIEKRDVIRASGNKWAVSTLDYRPSRYPKYASGIGYVMSADVLDRLVKEIKYVRPFPNEDAYVGVVVHRLGIEPIMSYRFTMYYFRWSDCNHRYMFCLHNVNLTEQRVLYRQSLDSWRNCPGAEPIKTWD